MDLGAVQGATDDTVLTGEGQAAGWPDPYNYSYPTLHALAFVLRPYLRVGWGSQTHTASPLFAFGSDDGSEELVGFRHSTELFRIMKTALGGSQ